MGPTSDRSLNMPTKLSTQDARKTYSSLSMSSEALRDWLPASNPWTTKRVFPLEYRRFRGDLILTYALFEQGLAKRFFNVDPANTAFAGLTVAIAASVNRRQTNLSVFKNRPMEKSIEADEDWKRRYVKEEERRRQQRFTRPDACGKARSILNGQAEVDLLVTDFTDSRVDTQDRDIRPSPPGRFCSCRSAAVVHLKATSEQRGSDALEETSLTWTERPKYVELSALLSVTDVKGATVNSTPKSQPSWIGSDERSQVVKPTGNPTTCADVDIGECCEYRTTTEAVKLPISSSTPSKVASLWTAVTQDPDSRSLKPDHRELESSSHTHLAKLIAGDSDVHTSAKEGRLQPNKPYTIRQIRKLPAGFKVQSSAKTSLMGAPPKQPLLGADTQLSRPQRDTFPIKPRQNAQETKQTRSCLNSLNNRKSGRPKGVIERAKRSSGRNVRPWRKTSYDKGKRPAQNGLPWGEKKPANEKQPLKPPIEHERQPLNDKNKTDPENFDEASISCINPLIRERKFCLMQVWALGLKIFLPCPRRVFAGSTVKNLLSKPCSNRATVARNIRHLKVVTVSSYNIKVTLPKYKTIVVVLMEIIENSGDIAERQNMLRFDFVLYLINRRLSVNQRLTEEELGTCWAILGHGIQCEEQPFAAGEFGKFITTQDVHKYPLRCQPSLLSM
ncbi:hypothetical protein CLF_100394 [Clonorchis sinensis]|uniref:Uncharacterized protein n=1 Tax=Clonorchis sinensis TaxID=79923 RepID=G7Y3C5_CLOSI|nr:hypothetical protein CLF_100394 [Clonorchis sinensis]